MNHLQPSKSTSASCNRNAPSRNTSTDESFDKNQSTDCDIEMMAKVIDAPVSSMNSSSDDDCQKHQTYNELETNVSNNTVPISPHRCLVGFLDKLAESMGRFEKYFGWSNINTDGGQQCGREKMITEGDNVHKHPHYERYSRVWSLLEEKNKYDMKLYDHAEKIFLNQAFLTQG
mmetsp:Transcript_10070/g.13429  ORF Transcript_10070/g.13429 Transcript_10070/m.13429 type:complete len:174 (+) Transcript_10070:793-1314(+)